MKTASKTITGALAAVLLTTAIATPADARDRRYHRRGGGGGISLGDVMLGTIGVVGVGVVLGALGDGRRRADRRYEDGRYEGGRYGDRGYDDRRYAGDADAERASFNACVDEAEREAGRRFGGDARIGAVEDVARFSDGYRIRGTVEVQNRDRYYDRDGGERVAFSCNADDGRVTAFSLGSSYARAY